MNLKSLIIPLALVVCAPVFADDAKITNAAIEQAAVEVTEEQVPEQPDQVADQVADDVQPAAPTTEELAGKLESFGEAFTEMRNSLENLNRLRPRDEVKFVIKDRGDYEYARDAMTRYELASRAAAIHLSPVHGVMNPRTLSEWVLADRLPARVQLQLHKYIWPPETRGV